MLACAVCGEPNPERARFCLQCGAQAAFAQALDLLDRKGNLVLARRVRAELLGV